MKHSIIAILAISAVIWAQSRITGGQLRRGSQTPAEIVAIDGAGQFYSLRLGSGVEIVGGELRAARPAPVRLTRNTDGSYDAQGRLAVARNGLVQLPGLDYRVESGRVVPLVPWDAEDVVAAF